MRKRILFIALNLVFTYFVIYFAITFTIKQATKQKPPFDYPAFEQGKSIGRNAMLQYMRGIYGSDTLKDTLTIDLYYLLKIEDSMCTVYLKSQKK